MKLLKSFHNAVAMLVIMLSALQFASCSSSSDEPKPDSPSKISKNELVGTWNGSRCFKSAHGGYKYSYVTAEFLSDGTGQVKQENDDDVISFMGGFTWTISGNTVKCQGVSASISGSVSMDFTISFEYRDGRLYAKDRFDSYILSKGSFTCINSEGKEIIDRSDYLDGVWISDDGKDMLDIEVHGFDNYTQSHTLHIRTYILTPNSKDSYEEMIEDKYAGYYIVENTLWTVSTDTENYNQVDFTITELNDKEMRLRHYDTVKRYTKGTYKDLPRKKNLDNKLAIVWEEFYDGITVLDLRTPGIYIEYTRTKAYSDTYTAKKVGSYSYDEDGLYMTITIGGQSETWKIEHLNEGDLTLSQSRKTMTFSPGDESSIPTIQDNDTPDNPDNPDNPTNPEDFWDDIIGYLYHDGWDWATKSYNSFKFELDGKVRYSEPASINYQGRLIILNAKGSYKIEGHELICDYNDVKWNGATEHPDLFPGWEYGKPTQKRYKITIIDKYHMDITMPSGETLYFNTENHWD